MTVIELHRGRFSVSSDPRRLDLAKVQQLLGRTSWWAKDTSPLTLARALAGSLCFGLYADSRQLGFARVVTDRATLGFLTDVVIDEPFQGQGLGNWLVRVACSHPELHGLRLFLVSAEGLTPLQGELATDPGPSSFCEVRVRLLGADEGQLLKQLRLAALAESPDLFGESLEAALARSDAEWRDQAASLAAAEGPRVFVAERGHGPAGLVLAAEDPVDPQTARLGGLWVDPPARRARVAVTLVDAVQAWAVALRRQRLRLWIHEDALTARCVWERLGFTYDGGSKALPRQPTRRLLQMTRELRLPES
ncbi:MAG TPA: GNAT family N-acetyltransferase [Polyangiaceae bacterium]|nr:GNAT family N-acetyltransferase [Polyangiaceae bacterium]